MLFIFRLPSFIKSDDTRNELNPASVNPSRHVCVKIVFLKIRGIDFEHYRCLPLLWLNKKARYFLLRNPVIASNIQINESNSRIYIYEKKIIITSHCQSLSTFAIKLLILDYTMYN